MRYKCKQTCSIWANCRAANQERAGSDFPSYYSQTVSGKVAVQLCPEPCHESKWVEELLQELHRPAICLLKLWWFCCLCYLMSLTERLNHVPVKLKGKPKCQTLSSKKCVNLPNSLSCIAIISSLEEFPVKSLEESRIWKNHKTAFRFESTLLFGFALIPFLVFKEFLL